MVENVFAFRKHEIVSITYKDGILKESKADTIPINNTWKGANRN